MRALLLAGAALAALSAPACALDRPEPIHPSEPQMRRQDFNPGGRTLIVGTLNRSLVLTFAPDEGIKRVVLGDEETWQAPKPQEVQQAPLGNILPLWPNKVGRTTLQVVTQKAGHPDRVYQFAAVVRELPKACGADGKQECDDDPEATYGLVFHYPEDERARKTAEAAEVRRAAQERFRAAQAQRERAVAVARLQTDFTCVNGAYEGVGDRSIAPDDACDDGQSIGLLFRGARQVPAVLLVGADNKTEQSIRTTARGDWVIVPALRERIRLRLGERLVVDVVNKNFDPRGRDPGTGTGSPDVVREVVQATQARAPR